MPDDHYVARTYLRHFVGPSGMLHAYRKSNGASFPCWPKDICHEQNGDIIPDFLSEPGYLGEFRAGFESLWNSSVEALKARAVDMRDKLHLAGYWAQLMICTPTWTRVAVETSNHNAINAVSAYDTMSTERGKPNETLTAAIGDINSGSIVVQTEPDFVRAENARNVLKFAWALYNADWDVYENETGTGYLTSDNPASFEDPGDRWGPPGSVPFVGYLPVTPKLCLRCDLTRNPDAFMHTKQDFTQEPKGTVQGGYINLETVQRINTCTVKCAEQLVLSSVESDYARDLTARYSRFHVETESTRLRERDGVLISNRTRCVERKDPLAQ